MKIILDSVTKKIRNTLVLNNINYTFLSGNIYGVVGQNGSGKTMLLRSIAGLIRPTCGSIHIDESILHQNIDFPPNMGLIIEKPELLPWLSGYENLALLADIRKVISTDEIKEIMTAFGLNPNSHKPIKTYSLGMKQKLGIIQAIMENPELLILDEPFNALDTDTVQMVQKLFIEYRQKNKLIVLTSHHESDISMLCNQILHIKNGCIINK